MIYNNVLLTVNNLADCPTVAGLLQELAERSRGEVGCQRFEVYQSQSDPQTFMLIEQWATDEDLQAHRGAPSFTQVYQPKVLPLVERTPHLCDLISA